MSTIERPIMLVEDDPLLRDALRLLLEDAGYRVLEAGNAAEALERSTIDPPSLILLDLGLPDRPGLEVARILRARHPTRDTPIVALTGRVGPGERSACIAAGCNSFLAKPVQPRELLRCVPEFMRSD